MRKITKLIIHCSDTDYDYHDDISVIRKFHLQRGFLDVGYHYYIKKSGEIQIGRMVEQIGSHAKGHNSNSIGICLGGKTSFSPEQYQSLKRLIKAFKEQYKIDNENVIGHCTVNKDKSCPNFNVKEYLIEYNV